MKMAEEKYDESGGLYYDHSTVYNNNKVDPFDSFYVQENIERMQIKKLSGIEKVNHPPHYNSGNIEVIDAIEDWGLDFIEGNVVKYITRSKHKGDRLGDLKKARWYLDYLIAKLTKKE